MNLRRLFDWFIRPAEYNAGFVPPELPPLERPPEHSEQWHNLNGQVALYSARAQILERKVAESRTTRDLESLREGTRHYD